MFDTQDLVKFQISEWRTRPPHFPWVNFKLHVWGKRNNKPIYHSKQTRQQVDISFWTRQNVIHTVRMVESTSRQLKIYRMYLNTCHICSLLRKKNTRIRYASSSKLRQFSNYQSNTVHTDIKISVFSPSPWKWRFACLKWRNMPHGTAWNSIRCERSFIRA